MNTQAVVDLTQSLESGKVRTETDSGVLVCGLRIPSSSVVNGFPVCGISFRFCRKNEIRKEYLGTGYCKSYYFRLSNG